MVHHQKQRASPAPTCQKKLTQLVYHQKQRALPAPTCQKKLAQLVFTRSKKYPLLLAKETRSARSKDHYLLLIAKQNSLNWFTTRSKKHYLLLIVKINSLNCLTTRSKRHCPLSQSAVCRQTQGPTPDLTCQKQLPQLVNHQKHYLLLLAKKNFTDLVNHQ